MGPGTQPKGFSDAYTTLSQPSQKAGSWSRCGHGLWHQVHDLTEGHCPWAAGMAAEVPNRGVCVSAHVPEALAGSLRGALLALWQLALGVRDTAGCKPHFPP